MVQRRYVLRAVGVAVVTMATALLMSSWPPEATALWQAFLQGVISGGAALGLNLAIRSR